MSDPDPARAETIDPMSARVIPAFVRAIGERYVQREAVVLDREVLTYRQLDARSAELARGLLARGVGKGTRVGLLLGNGPRWVTWWAAISRIGAVAVPLSTFARAGELRRTIRHADLHCLVLQPGHLRRSLTAELESAYVGLDTSSPTIRLEDAPYLRWAVVTGEDVPRWSRSVRWVRRDAVAEALLATAEAEVHPEDPALTIYTSGTSATPKGVVHTQGTVMRKIHYLRACSVCGPTAISWPTCPSSGSGDW